MRTAEQLFDKLAEERIWRVKEIGTVSSLASRTGLSPVEVEFYCRAGAALFYAHWEGYIKRAATYYLQYVADQRITIGEMSDFVLSLFMRQSLGDDGSTSTTTLVKVSRHLQQANVYRPKLRWKNIVDTGSNLSSVQLKKILLLTGLDYTLFETKFVMIDAKLLKFRNAIAHGDKGEVDSESLKELGDEVVILITLFRDLVENAVAMKAHIRSR